MNHQIHGFVTSTNLQLRFLQEQTCKRHKPPNLLKHPLEMEAPTLCMRAPTHTQIGIQCPLSLSPTLTDISYVLFIPWTTQHSFYIHCIQHHTLLRLLSLHRHLQHFTQQHWISLRVSFFCLGTLSLS